MKQVLSVLVIGALFSFFGTSAKAQQANVPRLHVDGKYFKDPYGNIVILRGFGFVSPDWGDKNRAGGMKWLIDKATNASEGWHPKVIRIMVEPAVWKSNPDAYFNKHLSPTVQHCIKKKVYCIVGWGKIANYNESATDRQIRAFWNYVAPKYKNTPNVLYELFNEPISPLAWSTWKATAQPWVDLVRSHAPQNIILIGGPHWDQMISGAANAPFKGNNLAYVAHIYPRTYYPHGWEAAVGVVANKHPVFVTEVGFQRVSKVGQTTVLGTLSNFGIPFKNWADKKGISWTVGTFDAAWEPVVFDYQWNVIGGENYQGQWVKDWLYEKRNSNLPALNPSLTPKVTRTRIPTVSISN